MSSSKESRKKMYSTIYIGITNSLVLLIKHSKLYLPVSIIYKAIQGFIPMIYVLIMQRMVNYIQSGTGNYNVVLMYILGFVGLHIGNGILVLLYEKYRQKFSLLFSKDVSVKMMKKSTKLSLSDFEDSETYDIINRAQGQNGTSILQYVDLVFEIFQLIISIMSMGYLLLNFNWRIAVVIAVVPVIRSISTYYIDKELYEKRMDRTSLEREKWYINFLVMTGNAYKEIKTLGIGPFLLKKYEIIQDRIIIQENKVFEKRTIVNVCLEVLDWLITGGIYFYIFILGFLGQILLGDVTAYIECTESIKCSVSSVFRGVNDLVDQSMYISRLFEYLDLPEISEINRKNIEVIRCIEFRNVSFKYSNGNYALRNANFFVKPGESIALVGENGSGKTTLSKLLLGLYDEYEGDIFINDTNLKEISMESYQKRIGIVFQDYIKYEATIRENVAFGNIDYMDNDAEIWSVLEEVNLDKKIKEKDGLNTIVGNWFGGQQCSIGEWQRLAIARALIKNADVYIFDEPDASLDVLRQREIVELFKKAMDGKIGFFISHRINYVNELADMIMVIQNGVINEVGTHDELIRKKGHYYNLYTEATKYSKPECLIESYA